jgi:hypothetical protein
MARINIEDEVAADFRFRRLVRKLADEDKAYGMLLRFWRIAQMYWGDEMKLIPFEEFEAEELQPILDCGLAEKREQGIYARGSEKHFAWYLQKCRASKKGVEVRQRKPAPQPEAPEENADQPSNEHDQPEHDFRLTGAHTPVNPPAPAPAPAPDNIIHEHLEHSAECPSVKLSLDLEILYQGYPKKRGKTPGLKTLRKQIKTEVDYENLKLAIQNYRRLVTDAGTKPEFMLYFSTFANQWRDWVQLEADAQTYSINVKPLTLEEIV